MKYLLFYASVAVVWLALPYIVRRKRIEAAHIITVILSSVYSLSFDSILGEHLKMYHYISSGISIPYMVIAGVFLYPLLNLFYLIFIPEGGYKKILPYIAVWIFLMLVYEAASVAAGTVVFTGWKLLPWSVVIYIFTYSWMTLLYFYLQKRPSTLVFCKKVS
jgi:hypothetical protein